jgi:hypothetical protein
MNTNNPHPIEVAILLAWASSQALVALAAGAVALIAALLPHGPAPAAPAAAELTPPAPAQAPPPAEHPLITVATRTAAPLQRLTVADLRRRARSAGLPRTLTRSGRRDALLTALLGLEVAMI